MIEMLPAKGSNPFAFVAQLLFELANTSGHPLQPLFVDAIVIQRLFPIGHISVFDNQFRDLVQECILRQVVKVVVDLFFGYFMVLELRQDCMKLIC